jgi:hypothetical protein
VIVFIGNPISHLSAPPQPCPPLKKTVRLRRRRREPRRQTERKAREPVAGKGDYEDMIGMNGIRNITGWWFQTGFMFHFIYGIIIPTDELHHFSEGMVITYLFMG